MKKYLNQDPHAVLREVWGYPDFRENQLEAIQDILNGEKDILFLARTGLGKALHKDTLIPVYPRGYKTMEALSVGDTVIAADGSPTKVMGKFQPKVDKIYELTFQSGEVIKCCKDHLWVLKDGSTVDTDHMYALFQDGPVALMKKERVKYPSIDLTSDVRSKSEWYAKSLITSLPDSYIYSQYARDVLEGILIELGYRSGNTYVVKSPNINVINTLREVLSILGLVYKFVSLFEYEYVVLFESEEVLCQSFKRNLDSYLRYLREEENIDTSVSDTDTVQGMRMIRDNPDDYYCITVDHPTHTYMATESFIPTHNSLVFQLPALIKEGMAIVISPLLALQYDQSIAAQKKGIRAYTYNSTLTLRQKRDVRQKVEAGEVDLLYIAPESILSMSLLEFLQESSISFIAMDEAHCTSQYGHDFRPDYQKVGGVLRSTFPDIPIIALTATADEVTKTDIIKTLKFGPKYKSYVQNLDRPNIHYHVYERIGNGYKQLLNILSDAEGRIIVYCSTKKACDDLSYFLNTKGYKSRPYYSTVKKKDKQKYMEEFSEGKIQVMCCTSSFGMGVDEEVKVVVCMALPSTLEDVAQYFGRAGRSGDKVDAYLLFDIKKDVSFRKWLANQSVSNPNRKKIVFEKIQQVAKFAASKECYRRLILGYFGQEHEGGCGSCSNCLNKIKL